MVRYFYTDDQLKFLKDKLNPQDFDDFYALSETFNVEQIIEHATDYSKRMGMSHEALRIDGKGYSLNEEALVLKIDRKFLKAYFKMTPDDNSADGIFAILSVNKIDAKKANQSAIIVPFKCKEGEPVAMAIGDRGVKGQQQWPTILKMKYILNEGHGGNVYYGEDSDIELGVAKALASIGIAKPTNNKKEDNLKS